MNISRRDFTTLLTLTLALPSQVLATPTPCTQPLRPPGALKEESFLARCNRCQRCIQVCPTRVIVPAALNYGLIALNTPVVSFGRSFCNSCLACSQLCPTGALQPVTRETLDIGVAVIIEKDCVAWGWIGCTVCVDECPLKAIILDDQKRPVVAADKCNGCGICELKCPATALRKSSQGKGILVGHRPPGMPPRQATGSPDTIKNA